jgi:hypothetical protein
MVCMYLHLMIMTDNSRMILVKYTISYSLDTAMCVGLDTETESSNSGDDASGL